MKKQRGRKSAAEKATLAVIDGSHARRLEPPADLSDYEAAKWNEIATAMPADWFNPENVDLLRAYVRTCRIIYEIDATHDKIVDGKALHQCDGNAVTVLMRLFDKRDKYVGKLIALGRALRITPHSRTNAVTAHNRRERDKKPAVQMPWEA